MERQGDLRSDKDWSRGAGTFPASEASDVHPGPLGPSSGEAEDHFPWSPGVLRGIKGRRGHSLGECGCQGPIEPLGKA